MFTPLGSWSVTVPPPEGRSEVRQVSRVGGGGLKKGAPHQMGVAIHQGSCCQDWTVIGGDLEGAACGAEQTTSQRL